MNIFNLYATIGLDTSEYDKGLKSSESKSKGFASKLGENLKKAGKQFGAFGKTAIKGIGVAVGAGSTAIAGLSKIGLDYNRQMESVTTDFAVMLGSQEKATAKVDELKKMASQTPFALDGLSQATKTLLAFNVDSEKTTGVLKQLGDISLGNEQKLNTLTRAFGKMNASQKVSLEDVNMMIDSGFNPLLLVAEETGESMEDLYDRVSKGGVAFEEIEWAIGKATSEGGQFHEGMAKASQTTEGLISTLKDNARALLGEVVAPISKTIGEGLLPEAIDSIAQLSEAFERDGVEGLIDTAGKMLAGFIQRLVDEAPKLVNTAVLLVSSLIEGLLENTDQLAESAVELTLIIIEGLGSLLPKIPKLVLSFIGALGSELIEQAPRILKDAIEIGSSIIEGINEGILALWDKLDEQLAKVGKFIIATLLSFFTDGLPRIVEQSKEIGTRIIEGVKNGIKEKATEAKEAVANLGKGMLKSFGKVLGIHSPSKEFEKRGEMTVAGLVKGIEGKAHDAIEASKQLGLDTQKGLEEGLEESEAFDKFYKKEVGKGEEAGEEIVEAVADGMKKKQSFLSKTISKIGSNFFSVGKNLFLDIGSKIGSKFIGGLLAGEIEGWDANKGITQNLIDSMTQAYEEGGLPAMMKEGSRLINGLISGISNNLDKVFEAALFVAKALLDGLVQILPRLPELAINIVTGLIDTILNFIPYVFENAGKIGEALIKGIWNGIVSLFSWLWDKIMSIFKGLGWFFRKIFGIKEPKKPKVEKEDTVSTPVPEPTKPDYSYSGGSVTTPSYNVPSASTDTESKTEDGKNVTIIQNIRSVPQTAYELEQTAYIYAEKLRWA